MGDGAARREGAAAYGSSMKPKYKRMVNVLLVLAIMGVALGGILTSFREQLIFFYTPTDLQERRAQESFDPTRELRVGGLVKMGSIRSEQGATHFIITDLSHEIAARYTGMLPALFREGQGVVAQGRIDASGRMEATNILAKHDENYMPKEVVDALRKSGRWQQ